MQALITFLAILAILSPAQLVLSAIRGCTEYRARKGLARIMADWEEFPPRNVIWVHEGEEAPF